MQQLVFPEVRRICPVCTSDARHGKRHTSPQTDDIHVVIVQGVHEQGPNTRHYSRRLCGDLKRDSPGLTHDGCFGRAACMLLGQTKWDRGCCQASWRSLSRAERTGRLWGFWIPLMLRQGARASKHLSDFFAGVGSCGDGVWSKSLRISPGAVLAWRLSEAGAGLGSLGDN